MKVSRVPDGVANTALGAEAADVRQRLFRCVSIRENETARMPSRRAACPEKSHRG
ncbi:host specificity domain protein [Escherichia coli 2853500]|nr:host specificity domain protein [Escherichia coli 2853500]